MDGEVLSATFVELADTLVAGFDVIDFLHVLTDRSVQLLDVSAAGLLLADPRGELRVVAASSEAARLLELFQLQTDQGPAWTASGPASPSILGTWLPQRTAGRGSLPPPSRRASPPCRPCRMRLREQVIGALNLFRARPGALSPAETSGGPALADVATISLLHERGGSPRLSSRSRSPHGAGISFQT